MKRSDYLRANALVNDMVRSHGLEFCRQFSYRGPRVTRTKFWAMNAKPFDTVMLLKRLKRLPFVESAEYRHYSNHKPDGSLQCTCPQCYASPSLYIRYK